MSDQYTPYGAGKIAGAAEERSRIIKLLEEHTGCGYEHRETEKCFCDAIALIKGENK